MISRQSMRLGAAVVVGGALVAASLGFQPQQQEQKQPEQSQEQPGRGPGARDGRAPQGPQPVGGGMRGMNRQLRTLKSQIQDATKREENLQAINAMEVACIAAKGGKLDDVLKNAKDEAERTAKAKHFRAEMIALARTLLDVEEALLNEKYAEAKTALDKAEAMRDHGHEEFGVKDD